VEGISIFQPGSEDTILISLKGTLY